MDTKHQTAYSTWQMREWDSWDSWFNAEIYREYVETFPIYRALNRRLVELAQLSEARRVVDVGCGTGATTFACLAELPADAEVEGVDAAETMLESARGSVTDPRARFVHARADRVDEVVMRGADRAVCNAAFWQFRQPARVIRALGRVLAPRGIFVFNVPFEQLANERVNPAPFQISLGQAVFERTGLRPALPRRLHVDVVARVLRDSGFSFRGLYPFTYHGRQGELMELMKVPALAAQLAPELGYDACLQLVRQAAENNDPDVNVDIPWAFFVAVRGAAGAPAPSAHRWRRERVV